MSTLWEFHNESRDVRQCIVCPPAGLHGHGALTSDVNNTYSYGVYALRVGLNRIWPDLQNMMPYNGAAVK